MAVTLLPFRPQKKYSLWELIASFSKRRRRKKERLWGLSYRSFSSHDPTDDEAIPNLFLFSLLLYAHIAAKKWRQISQCIVASFSSHSSMNKLGARMWARGFLFLAPDNFLVCCNKCKIAWHFHFGFDLIQFIIKSSSQSQSGSKRQSSSSFFFSRKKERDGEKTENHFLS